MDFEKKKTDNVCNCKGEFENAKNFTAAGNLQKIVEKPSLMLHSCCGPCSTAVIERLADEFNITVFFFNPCITEEAEYRKRKESQIQFIEAFNRENKGKYIIRFKEGDYRPAEFFRLTEGMENEPEGGVRCKVCIRQRLEKTAETAMLSGCDYFGTTLTVSPHKNYKMISRVGNEIALKCGSSFLDRDFKKKDGFKRSIELSKKYELYRQNYCGCKYSKQLGEKKNG